jgi:hypothetical protein
LQRVDAVYIEVSGAAGRGRTALVGVAGDLNARDDAQQVIPVAQIKRCFLNYIAGDQHADRGIVALQVKPGGVNLDRLVGCTDGQMQINSNALTDPNFQLLLGR